MVDGYQVRRYFWNPNVAVADSICLQKLRTEVLRLTVNKAKSQSCCREVSNYSSQRLQDLRNIIRISNLPSRVTCSLGTLFPKNQTCLVDEFPR